MPRIPAGHRAATHGFPGRHLLFARLARYRLPMVSNGGCGSSAKKSFPLSSTMMNAGKSRTSMR